MIAILNSAFQTLANPVVSTVLMSERIDGDLFPISKKPECNSLETQKFLESPEALQIIDIVKK